MVVHGRPNARANYIVMAPSTRVEVDDIIEIQIGKNQRAEYSVKPIEENLPTDYSE